MKISIKPMLSALAFAAGCSAPLAFADTITFDNADLTGVAVRPTIFTTQGFVFTAIDLELLGGGVEPYSNGSNVLSFGTQDRVSGMDINAITFRRQDAALFNLNSLEFSPGAYAGNLASMNIKGVYADGTTTSGFLTWHNSSGLTHVDLEEDWTNLASVVLTGNLLSHSYVQVDNINVTAVPEPTTYAMLFAGLGLLGIVRRRARRA